MVEALNAWTDCPLAVAPLSHQNGRKTHPRTTADRATFPPPLSAAYYLPGTRYNTINTIKIVIILHFQQLFQLTTIMINH